MTPEEKALAFVKQLIAEKPDVSIFDPEANELAAFAMLPQDTSKWTTDVWRRLLGLQNLRILELEKRFKSFLEEYETAYISLVDLLQQAIANVGPAPYLEIEPPVDELVLQSAPTPAPPVGPTRLDEAPNIAAGAFYPGLGGQI